MDVLANLVTPTQLSNWMTQAIGHDRANQDEWCYALNAITGAVCPAYDIGNGPEVKTSAEDFLTGLRNFQLGVNATYPGPGGSGAGGPVAALPPQASATPLGAGLFGPTNCQFCIWLRKNPWAIGLVAIAIYFAFFYKK